MTMGLSSKFVMLSLWVCQNGVCVPVWMCCLIQIWMQGPVRGLSLFIKGLERVNQHTYCSHALYVCVRVLSICGFMFFPPPSTSIFTVSVYQSVVKDKWTVDGSLMVWLMPCAPLSRERGIVFWRCDINCLSCLSFPIFPLLLLIPLGTNRFIRLFTEHIH